MKWIIGILLLVFVYAASNVETPPRGQKSDATGVQSASAPKVDWRSRDNSAIALGRVQKQVQQYLKSPGSAKFPGWAEATAHVARMPNHQYLVRSWVDSQNDFGAMLRTHYSALATQTDEYAWKIEIEIHQ